MAALRNVDATTWGHDASAQRQASVVVVVAVPALDPRLLEGSSALEFNVGGVQKVENVKFSKFHTELLAGAVGLVVRQRLADHKQVVLVERAGVQLAARASGIGNVRHSGRRNVSLDRREGGDGLRRHWDLLADKQRTFVRANHLGQVGNKDLTANGNLARLTLVSIEGLDGAVVGAALIHRLLQVRNIVLLNHRPLEAILSAGSIAVIQVGRIRRHHHKSTIALDAHVSAVLGLGVLLQGKVDSLVADTGQDLLHVRWDDDGTRYVRYILCLLGLGSDLLLLLLWLLLLLLLLGSRLGLGLRWLSGTD